MKKAIAAFALLASASLAAYGQQETLPQGGTAEGQTLEKQSGLEGTMDLLQTARLHGSAVKNGEGKEIGTIDQFLFDSKTGQLQFAVIDVGGFLGMGKHHVPVPWSALKMSRAEEGEHVYFTLDANKERLEKAPEFQADRAEEFATEDKLNSVYSYWGAQGR